jgi:hypothetical protein
MKTLCDLCDFVVEKEMNHEVEEVTQSKLFIQFYFELCLKNIIFVEHNIFI